MDEFDYLQPVEVFNCKSVLHFLLKNTSQLDALLKKTRMLKQQEEKRDKNNL